MSTTQLASSGRKVGLRHAIVGTLAAGAVMVATATAGFASPTGPATAPGPRWSPSWMAGKKTFTTQEAADTATRFPIVVGQPQALSPHVATMHAANPATKVIAYVNGAYTKSTTLAEGLYAHDASGARIQWTTFAIWQLELSNPAARTMVANLCTTARNAAPFDGCLLDNLGLTILNASDKSGLPVDPATGAVTTAADWMQNVALTIQATKAANPGAIVTANGLAWGKNYFAASGATRAITDAGAGGESEQFVRSATQAAGTFRKEADWKSDVDMIVDAESHGSWILAVSKLWVTATTAQQSALHRYSYATFLLGTNGTSYFQFLADRSLDTPIADSNLEKLPIGSPTGAYAKTDGAYQRAFTKGRVLVNPTNAAVTVPVTGVFHDSNGTLVTGSLRLAPYAAEILTLG